MGESGKKDTAEGKVDLISVDSLDVSKDPGPHDGQLGDVEVVRRVHEVGRVVVDVRHADDDGDGETCRSETYT